jgi:hypothetical protein
MNRFLYAHFISLPEWKPNPVCVQYMHYRVFFKYMQRCLKIYLFVYFISKKGKTKNLHLSLFCQYGTYFCYMFRKHVSIIIFLHHNRVELLSFLFQKFV